MAFLHRHRWLTPYLLLLPGLAWLFVFFLVPMLAMLNVSLLLLFVNVTCTDLLEPSQPVNTDAAVIGSE